LILSVCRLERQKRVDLLIRAFAYVRAAHPDAKLIIAGTGAEQTRLEALMRELSLGDAIAFAGYIPDSALWDYYAAADVLAAPAMADFIIAPYEAMALGCKAVWTTEMETDPEIEVSGQAFVAAPEERAFAQAIIDAIAAPSARADLRHMTWEARAERIEHVYGAAATERRAA
jgi:glycosyltransferase involved in cell wall biosynthesis